MNRVIHNIRRAILFIVVAMVVVVARAEQPTIKAYFSRDSVEVGDLFDYVIEIEKDRATEIGIPDFGDRLTPKQREEQHRKRLNMSTYEEYDDRIFELVESCPIDTLSVEGRTLRLRKRYRMQVMETGDMHLRPTILYFAKNRDLPDTIYARDTLTLSVARYEMYDTMSFLKADPMQGAVVDSLLAVGHLMVGGLATQKDMPFVFKEIQDYVIYGLMAAIALALVVWLVVSLVRRYLKQREVRVKPLPVLPPHVVANKALVELSHRKLWQNGKFKEYYTALATILRAYISARWSVGAMEMTTDEIITALVEVDMPRDSRMELIAVLRTADMVKFAKAQPDAEENEMSYNRAYYFVENTKEVTVEQNEGKEITIETKIGE